MTEKITESISNSPWSRSRSADGIHPWPWQCPLQCCSPSSGRRSSPSGWEGRCGLHPQSPCRRQNWKGEKVRLKISSTLVDGPTRATTLVGGHTGHYPCWWPHTGHYPCWWPHGPLPLLMATRATTLVDGPTRATTLVDGHTSHHPCWWPHGSSIDIFFHSIDSTVSLRRFSRWHSSFPSQWPSRQSRSPMGRLERGMDGCCPTIRSAGRLRTAEHL